MTTYLIIALFLVFTLAVGMIGHRSAKNTPDDYFLAGRGIGPVVLFFTLIATNFSAFFFLGFAGSGYRIGYSYYPIMGFGTGLVALAFFFVGHKAWQLGRHKGYITPPEMVGDLLQSKALKVVFLLVMVQFTLPYLAIQPTGAGYLVSGLTQGAIPYFWGAIILTVCIVIYVFLGGMRSVAFTDVLQGALMFVLMLVAVGVVGHALGGLREANGRVLELRPELFSRAGGGDFFTPRRWFSFMLLWVLAVPMFPQVFMRFFTPSTSRSLKVAATLYPVITAVLFICPVIIGVLGHLVFPGLEGTESDQILPMMLATLAPSWMSALILVGALAAFMSTMDSQLLALSSMLTRDLYMDFFKRSLSFESQVRIGRALIVVLAAAGLALAYRPPATIFAIATEAFTGLAILFPTTIAALYSRRATASSCVASILVGELLLVGFHYEWLPEALTFGFLPVVPILVVSASIIVAGSLVTPRRVTAR